MAAMMSQAHMAGFYPQHPGIERNSICRRMDQASRWNTNVCLKVPISGLLNTTGFPSADSGPLRLNNDRVVPLNLCPDSRQAP